jgi:hypothetical protein
MTAVYGRCYTCHSTVNPWYGCGDAGDSLSSAREHTLALVSGLPSTKRYSRLICMLQTHFDGSTEDGQVLVVAGYVATVSRWLEFDDKWQELLDKDGGKPFKMVRAAKTAKGMRRARAHFEIVDEYALAGVGCVIPIEPVNRIARELNLPKSFGNPYFVAWRALVSICFIHLKIAEPIEFIFDDQTERDEVLRSWDEYIRSAPLSIRKKMMGPPSFKRDDLVLPLQSADLMAWWGRKRFVTGELKDRIFYPPEWMAGRKEKMFFYHIPAELAGASRPGARSRGRTGTADWGINPLTPRCCGVWWFQQNGDDR